MSFQDRNYSRDSHRYGSSGDLGQRILGWLNASIPIGVYLGIRVRVHITFVMLLIFRLFHYGDPLWTLRWSGMVFLSVLLHEFGHCLACRAVGGQANDILMWPLGGLAFCAPPHRPWPEFVTVMWGPLVNVIIAALCLGALWFWHGSPLPATLNPFQVFYSSSYFLLGTGERLLVDAFDINYGLLLFNLLLIYYPFDGGRMVQIALWPKMGYARSMRLACSLGMAGAVITALIGLSTNNMMLVMIAIFGFMACYQQARYLREAGDFEFAYEPGTNFGQSTPRKGMLRRWREARAQKASKRQAQQRRHLEQEIDRILDKVHGRGLASLTASERRTLEEGSRQKSSAKR